jgi:hypothetical protein
MGSQRKAWLRPAFPLRHLDTLVYEAVNHALDVSTNQAYDSHLQSYLAFCHLHHLPITPTCSTFARYMVYMSKFIKPSSLNTYLSGIVHRLRAFFPNVGDIRNNDHLRDVLRGLHRQHGTTVSCKAPITFSDLNHVFTLYQQRSFDDVLFLALLSVGFFGLLRLGEITDPNDQRLLNRRKTIRRHSLSFTDSTAEFILPASKTDRFFAGNIVLLKSNHNNNDPVAILRQYINHRDELFPASPWLWLTSQGQCPTRRWFLNRFHLHFDNNYGGHSLHAGGATLLAQHHVSFDVIQTLGRWSSDAFRIYIRTHPALLLQS